jgi:hypothetical protein
MQNVFLSLLAPTAILWIGGLAFYVFDRLLKPQDAGVAEAALLLLALGALLWVGPEADPVVYGQALANVGWPGPVPTLVVERSTWILAALLLGIAGAASFSALAEGNAPGRRPDLDGQSDPDRASGQDRRVAGRAGRVATLGTALLFLFAGDWATLALTWVGVDLCLLYAQEETDHQLGRPAGRERGWTAVLSLCGAVALGVALTLWAPGSGELRPWGTALAAAAVVLRLLPFPLPAYSFRPGPLSRDATPGPAARSAQPSLLARLLPYLVPALLGAFLCARLADQAPTLNGGAWGTVGALWAAGALLVSALQAWLAREPAGTIASTASYGTALVLLSAALGLPPGWQLVLGVAAVLNVGALSVSWTQCPYLEIDDPRSYWRVAPTALALLSLAGLPLTIGFPARAALYHHLFAGDLFAGGHWLILVLLIAAEVGLLGALLRVLLDVECVLPADDAPGVSLPGPFDRAWRREIAYGASATLALVLLVLGVAPKLLGVEGLGAWLRLLQLGSWAAFLLPVVGAFMVYRAQEQVADWVEDWRPLLERTLDPRWAYRAAEWALHHLRSILWSANRVVHGAGYMGWVVLFGLVVLLIVLAG